MATSDQSWRVIAGPRAVERIGAALVLGAVEALGMFGETARALHAINGRLWALEEAVRDRSLPDGAVVRLKRLIDAENLGRHDAIHAIDHLIDVTAGPQRTPDDPDAVLDSHSVGEMIDRLSVLTLKAEAFAAAPARSAAIATRLQRLERSLERVGEALLRGEGVAQAFDEAKTYSA